MVLRPHLSMGLPLSLREAINQYSICIFSLSHLHLRVNSEKVLSMESECKVRISRDSQSLGILHP